MKEIKLIIVDELYERIEQQATERGMRIDRMLTFWLWEIEREKRANFEAATGRTLARPRESTGTG